MRTTTGNSEELRMKAEHLLDETRRSPQTGDKVALQELLHELSVHQIELELQNEELEQAREDAERAHARYFSLFDLAPVGYVGFDKDGGIRDINLAAASYLGSDRKHITGRRFQVFLDGSSVETFAGFLRDVFAIGSQSRCEVTTGGDSAGPRILHVEGITYEEEEGQVCHAALIDITARREAEHELVSAHRDLALTVDSAPGPIVCWDDRLRITLFNKAFARLTGRDARKMIGQPLALLFPEEHRARALEILRSTAAGVDQEGIEIPVLSMDGKTLVVLWNATRVTAPGDASPARNIAQGQEITRRKEAEEKLLVTNRDLTTTNARLVTLSEDLSKKEKTLSASLEEKDALLAEIHHRVRNNLAAFISLISLDGSDDNPPECTRLKQDLQNRARSMALVHETLFRTGHFSSVDMGMYLRELVDQAAAGFAPAPPVTIVVDAGDVTLDLARATPCGLIVNELVTNAFRYAFPAQAGRRDREDPPGISVTLARGDDAYRLTVRDNGIGLPAGFSPDEAKSMGFRLVRFLTCYQLMGTFAACPGSGTAFSITFPVTGPVENGL